MTTMPESCAAPLCCRVKSHAHACVVGLCAAGALTIYSACTLLKMSALNVLPPTGTCVAAAAVCGHSGNATAVVCAGAGG